MAAPTPKAAVSPSLMEQRHRYEAKLEEARQRLAANPDDPEALLWVGRHLGYLWRMREAIATFTEGIRRFPQDARFYRHRGHRLISVRHFDAAVADLQKAAELAEGRPDDIEQDGAPNARNIPLTTTQYNIWYHLGVAHYLRGDFEASLSAFRKDLEFTRGYADNLVAVSDWLYMCLRRLERDNEAEEILAPVHADMDIIENKAYHRRLLMYKGLLEPTDLLNDATASDLDLATMGYGVANWHWCNGETERAADIFHRIVTGPYWPAFGFIGAEVELAKATGPTQE